MNYLSNLIDSVIHMSFYPFSDCVLCLGNTFFITCEPHEIKHYLEYENVKQYHGLSYSLSIKKTFSFHSYLDLFISHPFLHYGVVTKNNFSAEIYASFKKDVFMMTYDDFCRMQVVFEFEKDKVEYLEERTFHENKYQDEPKKFYSISSDRNLFEKIKYVFITTFRVSTYIKYSPKRIPMWKLVPSLPI